MSHVGTKVVGS